MTGTDPATLAQFKVLAQQAADIALQDHVGKFASIERAIQALATTNETKAATPALAEIPAPMKWAAGIISAIMTAGVIALFFWLISTVNDMQQTLVRIDERQKAQTESKDSQFADHERRIGRLEKQNNVEGGN